MDGGGRLLQSIGGPGSPAAAVPFSLANANAFLGYPSRSGIAPRLPQTLWHAGWRRDRRARWILKRLTRSRYAGTVMALALLVGVSAYGAVRGGQYTELVAAHGTLPDILARTAGLHIKAVTITGARELTEGEVLDMAGIGPRNSLLFLDVAAVRARLKGVPLVKDVSVTKLYPNRLVIDIEERQPFALWQKDGAVAIVAADGTPIDDLKDPRFERLPLVVGEGANADLPAYVDVLDAAGEMRGRIRAGMFVAGRRWTLKMDNGVEVDLPEHDPAAAAARLASLEHDGHILEKDVVSLDMRIPGRVALRLSADAAAAVAEASAKKKKKGATT